MSIVSLRASLLVLTWRPMIVLSVSLIRADLKVPAKGLGLTIKPNARKSEFYQEVVFVLSEKGLVSESLVESLEG